MRSSLKTGAVAVAFAIAALASSPAVALPTKTVPCSGCHTLNASAVSLVVAPVSNDGKTASYSVNVGNPYGMNGWAVFDGPNKIAGAAGGGSTFAVSIGSTYTVFGVSGDGAGHEAYNSATLSPTAATTPTVPATPTAPATPAVPPTVPAKPSIAKSYSTNTGSVSISWTAVPAATTYEYYFTGGPVTSISAATVTLRGLVVGTSTLHVRAVNSAGASAYAIASVANTAKASSPKLRITFLKTYPRRYLGVRGTLPGALPIGKVSIRVYVRNGAGGKYRRYAYSAPWVYNGIGCTFSAKVRLPRTGRAYVVVSAAGMSAKTRVFKIKK